MYWKIKFTEINCKHDDVEMKDAAFVPSTEDTITINGHYGKVLKVHYDYDEMIVVVKYESK